MGKKKILLIISIVLLSISFIGCSILNSEEGSNEELVLSEDEKFIVDSVIESSGKFNNPVSARVLAVDLRYGDSDTRIIKIQSENAFGSLVDSNYMLYYKDSSYHSKGRLYDTYGVSIIEDEDIDIKKINKSIKKIWEDKGLD